MATRKPVAPVAPATPSAGLLDSLEAMHAALPAAPARPAKRQPAAKVERGMVDVQRVAKSLGLKVTATAFPGLGKAVKHESGALYINGGYADVRGSKEQVAAWVAAGKGVERSATYVRVAL